MKKHVICILAAAMIIVAMPMLSAAGNIGCKDFSRSYDPATVETVTGEVKKLHDLTKIEGVGSGICLFLKTAKETLPVHLGPQWVTRWGSHVLQRMDGKIAEGDTVTVTGSRVTLEGKTVIVASEVKKGAETLILRKDSGTPVWNGWEQQ